MDGHADRRDVRLSINNLYYIVCSCGVASHSTMRAHARCESGSPYIGQMPLCASRSCARRLRRNCPLRKVHPRDVRRDHRRSCLRCTFERWALSQIRIVYVEVSRRTPDGPGMHVVVWHCSCISRGRYPRTYFRWGVSMLARCRRCVTGMCDTRVNLLQSNTCVIEPPTPLWIPPL